MGRFAVIALLALAGCGDAIIAIGDQPGFMRIAAGVGTSGVASYDAVAIRARLSSPAGIVAAADGSIYFVDQPNAIVSVDATGKLRVLYKGPACTSNTCLRQPEGMAMSADNGTLLIADAGSGKLWQLTIATGELRVFVDSLAAPTDVVVLPDGRVLVSELAADRVSIIASNGVAQTFVGDLHGPAGLAVSDNTLFVAEAHSHTVRAVDLNNAASHVIAGTGTRGFSGDGGVATAAALNTPWSLVVSGSNLYIVDQANQRVRVVNTLSGIIGTFAGTGATTFTGNGRSAGETALSFPNGLEVSPLGFLYISDAGHGVIWRTPIQVI